MKITKNQLKRLIQEALPAGGVPDIVGYLNKGRPDPVVDAMIDDYEDFVEREGHVTRASASVAAAFLLQNPDLRDDHDAHQKLSDAIGLNHEDIMRAMKSQQRPGMSESSKKVKITRRQIAKLVEAYGMPDDLNLAVAMKIKDMMPPDEALSMSDAAFRDLVVSVYENHFDQTGEGWDPYPADIKEIEDHLTIIPEPGDPDYDPHMSENKRRRVRSLIREIQS